MDAGAGPVSTVNANGASPFVLVCDHASNHLPERYGDLGLSPMQRLMHIAWDPGALDVSLRLVELLNAPLVHSNVSRLIIDCNRDLDSPGLIPTLSEATEIHANENLTEEERQYRIAQFHAPFHSAIRALLDRRAAQGSETILVAMHSFTPIFLGVSRPWPIGLIHGADEGFTREVEVALNAEQLGGPVGWNEPYAALNGVTYTLEEHGDRRGLQAVMVEIRNDGILDREGVERWAHRIARALERARESVSNKRLAVTR